MKKILGFACVVGLLLSGCASTPYQQFGHSGGYEFRQLSKSEFLVAFAGNGFTKPKQAMDFAMLRAAETTLEYDYKFFVVKDVEDRSVKDNVALPATSNTQGTVTTYGNMSYFNGTTTTYQNNVPIYKPGVILRIKCFKEKVSGEGKIHDAVKFKAEIRKQYGL